MIMADILKIVFIVLGILTVYVSYWLLAQALFPRLVENTSSQYARPFKLTWLGLAIVQEIIAAHGGRVGAENRRGGGARFWFEVPWS